LKEYQSLNQGVLEARVATTLNFSRFGDFSPELGIFENTSLSYFVILFWYFGIYIFGFLNHVLLNIYVPVKNAVLQKAYSCSSHQKDNTLVS
jgi:hypothetical protein